MVKNILFWFVLIIFVLFLLSVLSLIIFGIKIPNIHYQNIKINSLYLKLDKRLNIKANTIDISFKTNDSNKSKPVDDQIHDIRKYVLDYFYLFDYIETIDIQNLKLNKDSLKVWTNGKDFKLSSIDFDINTNILIKENKISINTKNLYINKYDLNIAGQTDISKDEYKIDTNITAIIDDEYKFFAIASYQKDYVDINIKTGYLKDLFFIKRFAKIDKNISVWLYDNIQAKLKINKAKLKYHTKSQTLITDTIQADANVTDAKIKFHDKLNQVNSKNATIKYENEKLKITLNDGTYMGADINGTKVELKNFTGDKPLTLTLNINSNAIFDKNIKNILHTYKIKLPIVQKDGILQSKIMLTINLKDFDIDTKGKIEIKDANFDMFDMKLYVKKGHVNIDNNIININSTNTKLLGNMLKFDINNMTIDTNKSQINSDIFINSLALKDAKNTIIGLKNRQTTLDINYKNGITIDTPNLEIYTAIKDGVSYININNLKQFYDTSALLQDIQILEGSVFVKFINKKNIQFFFNIDKHNSPLMVDKIQLNGELKDDNIDIVSTDDNIKIHLNNKETKINIKDIDINTQKLKPSKNDNTTIKKTTISATYSNIKFGDKKALLATDFDLIIDGKKLYFLSKFLDTFVFFSKDELGNIFFKVENTQDIFINSALGIGYFSTGGRADIIGGNQNQNQDVLSGTATFKDVVFRDFAVLSSTLTLINSTMYLASPILVFPTVYRLIKGDVVFDGYKAIKGRISYSYNLKTQQLSLPQIYTKGGELDLRGEAKFDFQNRKIDAKIKAVVLKDISKLISNIPIFNKIFLGKTEDIYIRTYINGNLDKPKISFIK